MRLCWMVLLDGVSLGNAATRKSCARRDTFVPKPGCPGSHRLCTTGTFPSRGTAAPLRVRY